MAFCYRLKLRIPHPLKKGASKALQFKIPLPFKSRRFFRGRFGYEEMEGAENRMVEKTLKLFRNSDYRAF